MHEILRVAKIYGTVTHVATFELSALWADSGNVRLVLRDQLVARLRYRYRV
jgi:hypothetical protein